MRDEEGRNGGDIPRKREEYGRNGKSRVGREEGAGTPEREETRARREPLGGGERREISKSPEIASLLAACRPDLLHARPVLVACMHRCLTSTSQTLQSLSLSLSLQPASLARLRIFINAPGVDGK